MKTHIDLSRLATMAAALLTAAAGHSQNLTTLHAFASVSSLNGANPAANLVLSSNTLYGTTSAGGLTGSGTVFKVNADGSSFAVIHNFSPLIFRYLAPSNNADGGTPRAGLLLSGNTLFGTASEGGAPGYGTLFKVNVDGTGFASLYSFTNGIDGAEPMSALALSSGTLYGTTSKGGANGLGSIFSLGTNGLGFATLYSFSKTNAQGVNAGGMFPRAGLVFTNDLLYGTASAGGAAGWGAVFSFNISTMTFAPVYNFTNGMDGAKPESSLLLSGSTLFGTALAGGIASNGTVFALDLGPATTFSTLHSFSALDTNRDNSDGAAPESSLILSGNTLYGTASAGGSNAAGAVFGITMGASSFEFSNLYSFNAADTNGGANPQAGLVLSGNALYGTAFDGGLGNGAVFQINTNGGPSSFGAVVVFSNDTNGGYQPIANLVSVGNVLYGNTERSLAGDGGGVIYSLYTSGSGIETLFDFTTPGQGIQPTSGMILAGNKLYGATEFGGMTVDSFGDQGGTVFSIGTDGLDFEDFSIPITNAANPIGDLILSGNTLYGTGSGGLGNTSYGGVFKINADGSAFTLLYGFTNGNDGAYPLGGLVLSGDVLYGTTGGDGISTFGSVFSISTNGAPASFTNIYTFTNGPNGFSPFNTLVLSGGTLYGAAAFGGSNGEGTLFKVNTDGSGFTNIYTFSITDSNAFNPDGAFPYAGLILSGGTLYGAAAAAGPAGNGTLYQLNTDGSGFKVLHSFTAMDPVYSTNADGAQPYGSLLFSGNALYGVTSEGGIYGGGTVFALPLFPLAPIELHIQLAGTNVVLMWSNPAFYLQTAPNLRAAYTTIPSAASPYTNAITGSEQFFRLKGSP